LDECISNLQKICLNRNNIGDEGAKYLADAIKLNSMLLKVDLWNNNIGDEGVKYLEDAIKLNSMIEEIGIGGNNVGASQIEDILKENNEKGDELPQIHLCIF
jgi:proline dehydrogenase